MCKRIRVAILADSPLPALRDGAQGRGAGQGATWLPPLVKAFEGFDDLEIIWVCLDSTVKALVDEFHHGQRFMVFPHLREPHDLRLHYLLARWRLRKILGELKPDVVHVWGSERCYPAVLRGLGMPSLFSIQGNLTRYAEIGGLPDNWFWKAQPRYEGKWVHEATVIACESLWSREVALGYWPDKDIRVIEWGVHSLFYDIERQPSEVNPYLLYCGGLEWRKGVDVLFEALAMVPNRKWTLRLAGEGALRSEFESRDLAGVEWLGNLKWDELFRQMAGAWGLVMPTRADTGPSVVKEALVIGLPVIGSCNGGLRDYIKDGENGMHVDPLSAEHLAAVMADFMSDYLRIIRLGKDLREQDRAYFRPERAAEAFRKVYREIAGSRDG